jgi:hypothetical protein
MDIRLQTFGRERPYAVWSVIRADRAPRSALKKTACGCCGRVQYGWYGRRVRRFATCRAQDFGCSGTRSAARRMPPLRRVKRERLDFLSDNPHFTKRFAIYVGRRCRQASIRDVAKGLRLVWETVKTLEMQYMRAQACRHAGVRARSASTRSRSAKATTAIASWSATWFASGRSGSAAQIVPRPAWRRSTIGWDRKRAVKSSSP